jgi:hypothetical protein
MNWEMLAAIGQLAAAIGVIPSLIYLAMQIREQNKERRRAAVNVLTGQWSALVKSLADSSELADIYLRGLQHFDDLNPAEKIRFGAFLAMFFKNFEGMYHYLLDGTLKTALWGEIERTMTDLISYSGTQAWWSVRRHWHTEEFAVVVDRIISEAHKPNAYDRFIESHPPK